jgi:DDE superfamily endonuclease
VWALPFLTALCPSERYHTERGRTHRKLTDRARQLLWVVKRWLPERQIVVVADSSFAALDLLDAVRHAVTVVTRLRLDAALYEPAPARTGGEIGRPRKKGKRLPTLEHTLTHPQTVWHTVEVTQWYGRGKRTLQISTGTAVWYHSGLPAVPLRWVLVRDPEGKLDPQAFLCTDVAADAHQILEWFVQRWQVEVTFEEAREHLGVESQRQWNDRSIARTTPVLLGLYAWVTLLANQIIEGNRIRVRTAAWYAKEQATFSDTIAGVRRRLWMHCHFSLSDSQCEMVKIPRELLERLTDTLCYAA